ncbi:MAG TPA: sulfatase-like hydrolase/transferase [Vicinamibacterales bacterium]|nr:sulfatase-like hydrolase/transferase [Vicinamibacterales bacterium]
MFRRHLAVPVCQAAALMLQEMGGPISRVATRPHHLLLITYGFTGVETPALARIAAEGTVFEAAFAAVPLTLPSHASLFTGLYRPRLGVRDNASPPRAGSLTSPTAPGRRPWRSRGGASS